MGRLRMRRPIIRRPVPEHAGSHLKRSFHVKPGSLFNVVGIRSTDVFREFDAGQLPVCASVVPDVAAGTHPRVSLQACPMDLQIGLVEECRTTRSC